MTNIDGGVTLSGDLLMLYDTQAMTVIKVTTAYAMTNFKYVICIDSSTCIAADDSTSQFNYYKMTASDFLGPTDSITTYSISDTSTGPTNSMAVIAKRTNKTLLIILTNSPFWREPGCFPKSSS